MRFIIGLLNTDIGLQNLPNIQISHKFQCVDQPNQHIGIYYLRKKIQLSTSNLHHYIIFCVLQEHASLQNVDEVPFIFLKSNCNTARGSKSRFTCLGPFGTTTTILLDTLLFGNLATCYGRQLPIAPPPPSHHRPLMACTINM